MAVLNKNGFTLLEVLISTFLSALILFAIYSVFFSIRKTVDAVTDEREIYESGRVLIELLRKDIRGTKITGNTALICSKEEIDSKIFSRLDIITTSALKTDFYSEKEVGYYVIRDDEDNKLVLIRREAIVEGDVRYGGNYFEVSRLVDGFNISVYDGNSWFDEWDSKNSGRIPKTIRFEIKLKGKNNETPNTFIVEEEIPSQIS